jgi:hypothetical protein
VRSAEWGVRSEERGVRSEEWGEMFDCSLLLIIRICTKVVERCAELVEVGFGLSQNVSN